MTIITITIGLSSPLSLKFASKSRLLSKHLFDFADFTQRSFYFIDFSHFDRMNKDQKEVEQIESPESPSLAYNKPQMRIHSTLQDFQYLRKIGEGTYSIVYKVRRLADDTVYALKRIHLEKMQQKSQDSALNEVRILASLNNDHIIAYRDAFYEKGFLYLVLQYAEGGDLAGEIAVRKKEHTHFSQVEIWQVLLQLSLALAALHGQNIMHRDIKPANVFLSRQGTAKLGDLNVSKVVHQLCRTQAGTPYYASPEIWRDEPYDKSSDVWSLGCTIYEMAALSPPFLGEDLEAIYEQITQGISPPLPLFYSKELHKLIARMLDKQAKRRPSAEQLLQNVQRLVPEAFRGLAIVQRIKGQFRHKQTSSMGLLKTIFFPSCREKRFIEQEVNSYLPSPSFSRDNSLEQLHDLTSSIASVTMHLSRDPSKQHRGKTLKKGVSLYTSKDKENVGGYFRKNKEVICREKEGKLPQIKKKTVIK